MRKPPEYHRLTAVSRHTVGDSSLLAHPASSPQPGLAFTCPLKPRTLRNKVKPVSFPLLVFLPRSYHKKPFQRMLADRKPPATPREFEIRLKNPIYGGKAFAVCCIPGRGSANPFQSRGMGISCCCVGRGSEPQSPSSEREKSRPRGKRHDSCV